MVEPLAPGAPAAVTMAGTVVLVIPDLIFGVRVADAARALGFTPVDRTLRTLPTALNDDVALVVVDTGQRDDWAAAIRGLKADPRSAAIPVLAYGAHVDVESNRAAV